MDHFNPSICSNADEKCHQWKSIPPKMIIHWKAINHVNGIIITVKGLP
jgi:hypothetical protein